MKARQANIRAEPGAQVEPNVEPPCIAHRAITASDACVEPVTGERP